MEHRREFIEHLQYGKHIGEMLDIKNMQKRPQAPKPVFLGQESEKSENQIIIWIFRKYLKSAHGISVQNGSYAFPSELMRFRI